MVTVPHLLCDDFLDRMTAVPGVDLRRDVRLVQFVQMAHKLLRGVQTP